MPAIKSIGRIAASYDTKEIKARRKALPEK